MKLTASQYASIRLALPITSVAAIDGIYVFFATKPLPLATVIPCLIPLLTAIVVPPLLKNRAGR